MTVTRFTICEAGIITAFCGIEFLAELQYRVSISSKCTTVRVCVHILKIYLFYANINLQP